MPATVPRPRSPAQIAAARRNGARSRGPTTPEGKARASRNALKHGLAALHHLVLEDEAPSELEELTARLLAEVAPESEIEARLARRMAIAFWKGERAERIEVALFDAAPKLRPPQAGFEWEEADPLTTFDLRRFNAVRGYQAQQGRELSRCLKELRALRREPRAECPGEPEEPETTSQNKPESPPAPANDDALLLPIAGRLASADDARDRSEPPDPRLVPGSRVFDIWGQTGPEECRDSPAIQPSRTVGMPTAELVPAFGHDLRAGDRRPGPLAPARAAQIAGAR